MVEQPQIGTTQTCESSTKIFIISDARFVRECLAELLPRTGILCVSGSFSRLEEALSEIRNNAPDLILLDEALPDGPSAVRQIRDCAPQIPAVVMAVAETPDKVIAWAEVGAAGYIPRTAGISDIAPLLVEIREGKQTCSASVAGRMLRRLFDGAHNIAPAVATLTSRETQIAQLIAVGLSNKDIARRLNIGLATAKTHVHHVLGKLQLQRRGQAAIWMREHGGNW